MAIVELPENVVVSEAGPIDAVARAHMRAPAASLEQRIAWLQWMVSALGQRRGGSEQRFFITAVAASSMGVCSPDAQASNDLHGCGGLGEPEDATCAPLSRRMGFADCLGTKGVWSCGGQADSMQEARLVRKTGTTLGGVLCCRGD